MALIVKRPWTSQPQVAAPAIGAVSAMLAPTWGIDLGGGRPSVVSGTGAVTQNGAARTNPRATINRPALGTVYTLIAIARGGTPASNENIIGGDDAGSNRHFQFRLNATSGIFELIRFSDGGSQFATTTAAVTLSRPYVAIGVTNGLSMSCSAGNIAGVVSRGTTTMTGTTPSSYPASFATFIGARDSTIAAPFTGDMLGYVILPYAITAGQEASIIANPWQLFAPLPRRIWAPVASGVVTHATSGALTGDPATLSGTAAHIAVHGSTGALSGAGSTLAGTAAHIVVHSSTGALAGAGATAAGTAARLRAMATSGALAGGGATVAGTAARLHAFSATGALVGDPAVMAGTAARSGAAVIHATTGALAGAGATVSGAAARLRAMATSGALAGAGATITGATARAAAGAHAATGALSGGGATLAGTAARLRAFASSGALAGNGATLAGTAAHVAIHAASGALVGATAIVAGTAAHQVVHAASGILVGGAAVLAGAASRSRPGSGATAAEVWGYILSNGLSAEQNMVDIRAMLAARPSTADIATAVWNKTLP